MLRNDRQVVLARRPVRRLALVNHVHNHCGRVGEGEQVPQHALKRRAVGLLHHVERVLCTEIGSLQHRAGIHMSSSDRARQDATDPPHAQRTQAASALTLDVALNAVCSGHTRVLAAWHQALQTKRQAALQRGERAHQRAGWSLTPKLTNTKSTEVFTMWCTHAA